MLNSLPKEGEYVFKGHYANLRSLQRCFERCRKRIAAKLNNPRLLKITFHTLRHWKGTTLYRQTRDILFVMRFLGHRNIKNTMVYVNLAEALNGERDDEYVSAVAKTVEEVRRLVEQGFEYVCDVENFKVFRKRK